MTKRQTWLFFVGATSICALVFLGMTVHSHTRFDELTNAENLTPKVKHGMEVWHEFNCVNCHTLLGEGAYYAPDLTHITAQRGENYLKAFLKNPSQFYSAQEDRRVMPNLEMSDQQIDQVIAFLSWVDKIDNHGWPPRPIRVSGSAVPGANRGARPDRAASDDPVELGKQLFSDAKTGCNSCHSTSKGVEIVGPSLAGIEKRAAQTIASDDYNGSATDAEGYIRESILKPNAHLLSGPNYTTNGESMMPHDYPDRLNDEEVDHLVAYLMSLN